MRILSLAASNIMRIVAVEIRPTRNVVEITGPNDSGKSSVLDAIWWALAGKDAIGSMPVRKGQERAVIRLDLGDIIVVRTFKADGTTKLSVSAADGAEYRSPQKMLDALLGSLTLTFDPLAFAELPAKAQFEELRHLAPLDVDIDALELANERDYSMRTQWGHKKASLTERLATLAEGVNPSMDVELIDDSAMLEQMERASEHNAAIVTERSARAARQQTFDGLNGRAGELWNRARELRRQADEMEAMGNRVAKEAIVMINAAAAEPPLPEPIDTADIRERIKDARKLNALREHQQRQREAHQRAADELQEATSTVQNLTAAMDDRTRQKRESIARAAMPVDGLSFGEGEVLYNGVPFAQASTAQKIRVGFELAIARNPKLRVIRIQDGSLLDDRSMALIGALAEQHDMQVWIERVSTDGQVGIVMEAGEVVAVDGMPVDPKSATAAAWS